MLFRSITDANLALGRMDPENFLSGRMTLDIAAAEKALSDYGAQYGLDQYTAAEGICTIANHMMADAIREITVRRGIDPRDFTLLSFGGAGPMHACLIAEELDIGEVIVPLVPGAFSAWGMLQADVRHDSVRTPVSYTHLDVYKRQGLSCSACYSCPKCSRSPGSGWPFRSRSLQPCFFP